MTKTENKCCKKCIGYDNGSLVILCNNARCECHTKECHNPSHLTELLQSLIVELEGEKKAHIKEKGERKNINHSKDEYWGCCECYEDKWCNEGLNLAQERIRAKLK